MDSLVSACLSVIESQIDPQEIVRPTSFDDIVQAAHENADSVGRLFRALKLVLKAIHVDDHRADGRELV